MLRTLYASFYKQTSDISHAKERALYTLYIHSTKRLNLGPSLWPKLEATHLLYVFEQRFQKLELNFLLEMLIPRTVFCVVHDSIHICK